MAKHEWTGLGAADMTQEQAAVWMGVDGYESTPVSLFINEVICVVCDSTVRDALPECLGPREPTSDAPHSWKAVMTLAMSSEDAAVWAAADGAVDVAGIPRGVALVCSLCGQTVEEADDTCPERAFWLHGVTRDWDPVDFMEGCGSAHDSNEEAS